MQLVPRCVLLITGIACSASLRSMAAVDQSLTAVRLSPETTAKVSPAILYTDITRVRFPSLTHEIRKLPPPLWFNLNIESSQRVETNINQTANQNLTDYVFRADPSAIVGYNYYQSKDGTKRSGMFSDYQLTKDVFTRGASLTFPTNQLVGGGLFYQCMPFQSWHQRIINYLAPATLYLACEQREIWQTSHTRQGNLLPGIYLSRPHQSSTQPDTFASVILTLVSAQPFVVQPQEIDPAYTVGMQKAFGNSTLVVSSTLLTNFRNPPFRGALPGNNQIICSADWNRPIKKLPRTSGFLHIDSVWNWAGRENPGISGYDFRLFSGLRWGLSKSATRKRPTT